MCLCVCRQPSPFHTLHTPYKNSKNYLRTHHIPSTPTLTLHTPIRIPKNYLRTHHPPPPLPIPPSAPPLLHGEGGCLRCRGRGKMFKKFSKKMHLKHTHPLTPTPTPTPESFFCGFQLNLDPHLIQKGKNRKNHLLNFKYRATQC